MDPSKNKTHTTGAAFSRVQISFIRILDIPYCEVVKSQNIDRVEGKCYRMIIISTDNTYQRTVVSKRYDDEEHDDDDMFNRLPENSTPTASFAISDCSACEKAESGKNSRARDGNTDGPRTGLSQVKTWIMCSSRCHHPIIRQLPGPPANTAV